MVCCYALRCCCDEGRQTCANETTVDDSDELRKIKCGTAALQSYPFGVFFFFCVYAANAAYGTEGCNCSNIRSISGDYNIYDHPKTLPLAHLKSMNTAFSFYSVIYWLPIHFSSFKYLLTVDGALMVVVQWNAWNAWNMYAILRVGEWMFHCPLSIIIFLSLSFSYSNARCYDDLDFALIIFIFCYSIRFECKITASIIKRFILDAQKCKILALSFGSFIMQLMGIFAMFITKCIFW